MYVKVPDKSNSGLELIRVLNRTSPLDDHDRICIQNEFASTYYLLDSLDHFHIIDAEM